MYETIFYISGNLKEMLGIREKRFILLSPNAMKDSTKNPHRHAAIATNVIIFEEW